MEIFLKGDLFPPSFRFVSGFARNH
jgi:hypothetical protein